MFKSLKTAYYLVVFTLLSLSINAQIEDPVSWSFSTEVVNNETYIVSKATIDPGWHLYSQYLESDDGPIPTEITFKKTSAFELIGKNEEKSKVVTEYDPNFAMNLNFFKKEAIFKQKIKNLSVTDHEVTVVVYYMVCDDEKCLPPSEEEYKVTVKANPKGKVKLIPAAGSKTNNFVAPDLEIETPQNQEPEKKNDQLNNLSDPIKWSFYSNELAPNEYEIVAEAQLEKGWHIYASELPTDDGPVATAFTINKGDQYEQIDKTAEEGKLISAYDKNFEAELKYYENFYIIKQKIKLNDGVKASDVTINGEVYYMVCTDEKCLPPTPEEFGFNLADNKKSVDLANNSNLASEEIIPQLENFDLENPVNDCGGEKDDSQKSLWIWFILGLGGGLFAILTPCVYPMIPLTVSFFTKGGKEKGNGIGKATLYGFFIMLIYVSLSIPFHVTDQDPQIFNAIATNPILNIGFFIVFVFFAFSFFGYYELTLPSKWSNKSDSASNKGGFIGIFFMALTLALVSFSCTGPILGSVLAGVLKDGPWPLTSALLGFGIGLGVPFAIFAAFPSLMKSLPQSGGWLNAVKVTLGFIELGLALKFLSNADLVEQWGLIKRETFFAIWILLALGLIAYYLNLIRFPHDSKKRKLSFGKVSLAILIGCFVLYLIPGLTCGDGANRRLVSGFPPPLFYSYCNDGSNKCPLGLDCRKDFEEGRAFAEKLDKPILLDFTGWACVSCREVEENIWPDPEVFKLISEEYVLVSLYVDDARELPENEKGVVEIKYDNGTVKKKKIKTIGDKWFTFETIAFKNNSQPRYALLSPDGHLLNNPISYKDIRQNGGAEFYADFLECGLEAYEKLKNN